MTLPLAKLAALAVAVSAVACGGGHDGGGSVDQGNVGAPYPSVPIPSNTLPVPIVRQQTNFDGGDAVVLSVLRYWAWGAYEADPDSALFQPLLTTTQNGTEPYDMVTYLNQVPGITAQYKTDVAVSDLEAAVDAGQPVIVDFQAWPLPMVDWSSDWEDGTYGVLVGYDDANLYFMDPFTSGHYAYVARPDFDLRWHDLVGDVGVRTSHMAVFVQSTNAARAALPMPPDTSPMN